jgi:hypothetical protein
MADLRAAAALGIDDLKVAEPARPPAPEVTLALDCRRRARLLGRAPHLRLERDLMVVHHPLLAEPLVVPRDDVVVAAVDSRTREGGSTLRFPFSQHFDPGPGGEAETYGWLYVHGARSPLPFLAGSPGLPNVAVVFREPLAVRPRGRRGRRLITGPLPGFFARAAAPGAARSALRDWGVMRPLTVADAQHAGAAPAAALTA